MTKMRGLPLLTACLLLCLLLATCGAQPTPTTAPPTPTVTPIPKPTDEPTALPAPVYTPTPEPLVLAPAWFDNAILYEVFVRSFCDGDGDGTGDLAGLTGCLDHVQSLGATAIWLMPIHPSPSYHGYDVADYFAIHPDFGSLEDMIALVDAAHERGIHIIMDLVVNHMSNEHPVFRDAYGNPDSEYADWFLWTNDGHTAYQAFGGFKHMPRLNHDNPEVLAYVLDIARFWMDLDGDGDYADGVDGFRADVAKEVPLATWQALRAEMKSLNSESFLLGEVWERNAQSMKRFYDNAFDALFDFPLYHGVAADHDVNEDSLLAGADSPDLARMNIVGQERVFPPGFQIARFVNNHDTNRAMSDAGVDWDRARTAATLLLTVSRTPMIYYGEEIGMQGEKGRGNPYWDEYRREPMDWYAAEEGEGMTTWFKPGDRFNAPGDGISVEEQDGVPGSLLEHYRALAALRHDHPALRTGALVAAKVSEAEQILAYVRHAPASGGTPEEWFLVLLNFDDQLQAPSIQLSGAFPGPFVAADALSGEPWPDVPAGEPYQVELPAAGGVVLQLTVETP